MLSLSDRFQQNGFDADEYTQAAALYFRALNFIFGEQVVSVLSRQIKSDVFQFSNIQVAASRGMQTPLRRIQNVRSTSNLTDSTRELTRLLLGPLLPSKAMRRGQLSSITLAEYQLAASFHYCLAAHLHSIQSTALFDERCAVIDTLNALLMRDTLTNGFESDTVNKLCRRLLATQPAEFFSTGFPVDFFVNDRVQAANRKGKQGFIVCMKNSLSTWFMETEAQAKQCADRLVFPV